MQYIPCNGALLAQETLFLTQKGTFLPKNLQKVRKSQQILICGKIAFPVPPHNFCHPVQMSKARPYGRHVRALHLLWKITIISNLLLAVWRHRPEEGIFLDIIIIELLNFIPSPVSDTDLLPENRPSFGNSCVLWSRLQDLVRNVPESDSSYMTKKSK